MNAFWLAVTIVATVPAAADLTALRSDLRTLAIHAGCATSPKDTVTDAREVRVNMVSVDGKTVDLEASCDLDEIPTLPTREGP